MTSALMSGRPSAHRMISVRNSVSFVTTAREPQASVRLQTAKRVITDLDVNYSV